MHHPFKAYAPAALALALSIGTAWFAQPAHAQLTVLANITNPADAPSAADNAAIQSDFNAFTQDFPLLTPLTLTAAITWDNEGLGGLGGSLSSSGAFQTVNGVLVVNPLAEYIDGAPSSVTAGAPGGADFDITLNNDSEAGAPVFSPILGPNPPGTYNLADTLFHETLHSMGFLADNSADGSYSFGAPTIWDTFLYDGITKQAFTLDTQAQRAAVMTSGTDDSGDGGELFFDGPNAVAANGGQMVQLFAPNVFQPGSSDGSHLGPLEDVLGPDLLDPGAYDGTYLVPSAVDLGALADLGWTTQYHATLTPNSSAVPEPSSFALLGLGLVPLALAARKRRRSA